MAFPTLAQIQNTTIPFWFWIVIILIVGFLIYKTIGSIWSVQIRRKK